MPRFAPLALFALSLFGSVYAAESAPRVLKDVTFLAPGRAEKLDVYLPATLPAGTLAPAVVWIHGGGWTGGNSGVAGDPYNTNGNMTASENLGCSNTYAVIYCVEQ